MTPHLAGTPVLETERLTLRAPEAADWPAFSRYIRSDRAIFVGRGPGTSEREAWRVFCLLAGHWLANGEGPFTLVERSTGRAIGEVGPWNPPGKPEREISWTIWYTDCEGKGLMREAAARVIEHAFRDLGWPTAVSYIDEHNARSIRLAERLGAVRDDAAPKPDDDEPPVLVYRHARPKVVA